MNRNNVLKENEHKLSFKKHLITVGMLNEIAVRLVARYQLIEEDPYNISLSMSIREEEIIFSRFLSSLFHIDIKSSAELTEFIVTAAEITMDSVYLNLPLFQSVFVVEPVL